MASGGYLIAGTVRTETIFRPLVDTNALGLGLAADVVDGLGLAFSREVEVETATGAATCRLMEGLSLEISGRRWQSSCLELPSGARPFIGFVPLLAMGLKPDLPIGN